MTTRTTDNAHDYRAGYTLLDVQFEGQPVYHHKGLDALRYEPLNKNVLLSLSPSTEAEIRRQYLPNTVTHRSHPLHRQGSFVILVPTVEWPCRRGAVLYADGAGYSLRVVGTQAANGGDRKTVDEPATEFWPASHIVVVSEAQPTTSESTLLARDT